MNKLILSLGILAGFAFFTVAYGASVFSVFQGGTGVGTFTSSQLLYGNGTNPLSSVGTSTFQIGTGLSFSGTIGYLVGGTAGTITNTGVISNSCSSGISCSGTNPSAFTNSGVTSIVAGTGISVSGATGAVTVNATGGGGGGSGTVSTSTNETAGFLSYWTSNSATPALLGKVATGTVSASGGITATAGQSIIGSGLTIGCTAAGSGATGCLSSTDWNTFNNKQGTIAVTWPITLSGSNIGFGGLSTTSALTQGQALYATGVNTIAGTPTTTVSCASGTSCTSFSVFGSSPITITATGGGGSGGTWSTTTSQVAGQLINYPNNTTDIVNIGSTATATSKFYFDPNTVTASFGTPGTSGGTLTVNGQASFNGPIKIGTSTATTTIWGNTATSTFASGINLTNGGCFAIGGVCLPTTGLSTYDAFTHPSANVSATTSGLIITASSTIGNGSQTGGLTVSGGATTTGYIAVQSTGTSTFVGGINMTGTDCFATQGTCLQTFIQNATAYKQAANYATAAVLAGTPTYNNGSSGVGATLTEVGTGALVVDGQNPSAGQRVLIKNQADQTTNGIYTVTATGSGIASYILTRATDYNSSLDVYAGTTVPILVGGTANGDTQWTESNTGTIVIGTSNITFIETSTGTAGTVTSVALTVPSFLSVSGSPITSSGTFGITLSGTALPIANGGTGTTTAPVSQLLYGGSTAYQSVPTTTASCSGNASCTAFTIIGSSPVTISASGGGGSSVVSTSTNETAGQLAYWTSNSATPALLGKVATGTVAAGSGITVTAGQSIIGSGLTITNTGLLTYDAWTHPASGQSATTSVLLTQLISGTSTIGSLTATSSITNKSVVSALVLNSSTGLEGAYAGSNPCTNQVALSLSALGVISCTSITDAMLSSTFLKTYDAFSPQATTFNTAMSATTSPVWFKGGIFASSTVMYALGSTTFQPNGFVGFASTTPWSLLSIGTGVGTSNASSSVTVAEYRYGRTGNAATSTAATIDCRTSNNIAWPIGQSATTLTLNGLTPGQHCVITVQNPTTAAGALTWAVSSGYTLVWAGATIPTQTTAANRGDVWSFLTSQGSSTILIIGAATGL